MTYQEWSDSLLSFKLTTWGWQERIGEEGRRQLAHSLFGNDKPQYLVFWNEDLELEYEVLPMTQEGDRIDLPPITVAAKQQEEWKKEQARRRQLEKEKGIDPPAHVLAASLKEQSKSGRPKKS